MYDQTKNFKKEFAVLDATSDVLKAITCKQVL